MLVLNSRLVNVPVMSLQSGTSLGTTNKPIIDPRKLQIVAFYVSGPRIRGGHVVHTSDIREYGPLGFIVDSTDAIMALDEDLVRLQEVIHLQFNLIGKPVFDETKKRLGKVAEYTVESDGFFVQKIHVAQSMMKNLTSKDLIIHRSQIVELSDHRIVVRAGSVPQELGLAQVLNPFRKASRPLTPEA